jgi:hypothetical protein
VERARRAEPGFTLHLARRSACWQDLERLFKAFLMPNQPIVHGFTVQAAIKFAVFWWDVQDELKSDAYIFGLARTGSAIGWCSNKPLPPLQLPNIVDICAQL